MRNSLCLLVFLLSVTSCTTLSSVERAERDAKVAQAVEKILSERCFTVNVSMMYPRRGKAVNVTSEFSLQVEGDTLVSYLPYYGRAYNVPYGGGKGLNFTAPIQDYREARGHKGNTLISFVVNNGEDILSYTLDIYSNGSASINVISRNRESISFSGYLQL